MPSEFNRQCTWLGPGCDNFAACSAEKAAMVARIDALEVAMREAIRDCKQPCVNYCHIYTPYGRHAPECMLDTAEMLQEALKAPAADRPAE